MFAQGKSPFYQKISVVSPGWASPFKMFVFDGKNFFSLKERKKHNGNASARTNKNIHFFCLITNREVA